MSDKDKTGIIKLFDSAVAGISEGHNNEFQKLMALCSEELQYDNFFRISGEGIIMSAKNTWLGYRASILKVPLRKIFSKPHLLERFFAGCEVQTKLHRVLPFHIPDIYRVSRKKPYFYEMEMVKGVSLLKYAQLTRNNDAILDIFIKLCEVVNAVHEYGFIHRDLKPQNVIVRKEKDEKVPVLIDWGLAKKPQRRNITRMNTAMGTSLYSSPHSDLDAATCSFEDDVWSLARMLWVVFTRREPELPSNRNYATHADFPINELMAVPEILEFYQEWEDKPIATVKEFIAKLKEKTGYESKDSGINDLEASFDHIPLPAAEVESSIDIVDLDIDKELYSDPVVDAFLKAVYLANKIIDKEIINEGD